MNELAHSLGIDEESPEVRRALALAEGDHQFLRALVRERKRRMTQQAVADALGISQAAVAAFERYDNDPKLSTIRRYAQVVGLLIAHCVEPDEGQLSATEPGSAWAPSWRTSGTAELRPTVKPTQAAEQFVVPSASVDVTDFALAS